MRSKKVIITIVFLILLLSQIPFACRRYKLQRLNAAIQLVNSERTTRERDNRFTEYKGVLHVHSFLGGHSSGTFSEIIAAAQRNQLQFVIMTEHAEKDFDTAAMTLNGVHGGVLFIGGNEVSTTNGDRLLLLPGEESFSETGRASTRELTAKTSTHGSLAIVAYPEEFKSWDATGLDGVEVYNVYSNARRVSPVKAFFDVLWSHRAYPDLLFALYYERPDENLKKWDQAMLRTKLIATAGNDAHANVGISLSDSAGKTLAGIQLDTYDTSFRLVRLHVLIAQDKTLETASLLEALRAGHCFIGFDLLGDTSGFSFAVENPGETKIQGDEIILQEETRLKVDTPVSSRLLLFKDGSVVLDESGITTRDLPITERGVYRVEVYLPQLGTVVAEKPWIISNPIYVR